MADDADVERAAAPVRTSRVSGQVHALGPSKPPRTDPRLGEIATFTIPALPRWSIALAVIAAVALSVVLNDVRWGVLGAVAFAAAIVLHRFARRVQFSFGEGFLPYRSDLGWPRGVQEDDDVRWAWANGRRA